jgi:hypothetical protein
VFSMYAVTGRSLAASGRNVRCVTAAGRVEMRQLLGGFDAAVRHVRRDADVGEAIMQEQASGGIAERSQTALRWLDRFRASRFRRPRTPEAHQCQHVSVEAARRF